MTANRWNRAALVVAVVSVVAAASWIAVGSEWRSTPAGRADSPVPALVLKHTSRDFGTVTQGKALTASFPVENAGTRRLVLVERRGGCCGRSGGQRSVVLEPGDSTDLDVEADTARWCGRMDHRVTYFTNDPATPSFSLHVTAEVTAPSS